MDLYRHPGPPKHRERRSRGLQGDNPHLLPHKPLSCSPCSGPAPWSPLDTLQLMPEVAGTDPGICYFLRWDWHGLVPSYKRNCVSCKWTQSADTQNSRRKLGIKTPPSLMSKARLLTLSFQIVPLKSKQLLEQLKRELDCGCAKLRRSFALSNQDTTSECLWPCRWRAAFAPEAAVSETWSIRWVHGEADEVPSPLWAEQGRDSGSLLLGWGLKVPQSQRTRGGKSANTAGLCTVPGRSAPDSDWRLGTALKKLQWSLKMTPACVSAER